MDRERIDKIKEVAMEYSNLYLSNKLDVMSNLMKYEYLAGRYTGHETAAISELTNVYVNLKEKRITREEASKKQRQIIFELARAEAKAAA